MASNQCFLDFSRLLCPILVPRRLERGLYQRRYASKGESAGKELVYRDFIRRIKHCRGGAAGLQCTARKPQSGKAGNVWFFEGQRACLRKIETRCRAI